jgi:myo-inositol-1(or 4)-monophosphatase
MIEAARAAGAGLVADQARLHELVIRSKAGPADMVSQADERAEATVRDMLGREYPAYGFLGEEGGRSGDPDAPTWIVDPLDGTTNFLVGSPLFGVNIALAQGDDVLAGVTWLPLLGEMFTAEKGKGAQLNGKPMRVSSRPSLDTAVLGCGIPFATKPDHDLFVSEMNVLTDRIAGIRRTGSAAMDLAYVAAGRWDAYWEQSLQPWDLAAGAVLVAEAGGMVTAADGSPLTLEGQTILACNPLIQPDVLAALAEAARPERRKAVQWTG